MIHRHSHRHRFAHENLYVYINSKEVLTIKNIEKMAIINIDVQDNQADLDALKARVQPAADALTAAITELQAVASEFSAFQITFNASVAPATPAPAPEPPAEPAA